MRATPCLALVLTACAHASAHFYPANPEGAVPDQPEAATAEAAGVRLTVHAGDWRGSPDDLEDRITPVEVYLENESGKAIRVGPEHFGLLAQNGFRYQPLDPREVQRLARSSYRGTVVYYGFYGAYPWPGFWRPYRHRFYPYMGWGWYGAPAVAYVEPPASVQPPPATRGTLENGGNISLLLFFPVPAASLARIELTANLVDQAGTPLGTVRVPLVRLGAPPAQPPANAPPPPATPPSPPPSGHQK